MTALIEYINTQIAACLDTSPTRFRFYGVCEILLGDNEQFPAVIFAPGSPPGRAQGTKVVPSETKAITIYHRLLSGSPEPSEEFSFGRSVTIENKQQIRTVVFIEIGEDPSLIDDIINALPDSFNVSGYSLANVSKNINLIRDRDAIWREEYSDAYKDKYQMKFHIYALEFSLNYIKCKPC